MPQILIQNVHIFDGEGGGLFPGAVLVEDGRIRKVARGGNYINRGCAEVIDARGATLMPGLIEPHAHLTFASSVDRIVPSFLPPPEDHVFYTAHNAKTLLDFGFTSALSGGATRPSIEVRLRDEIARGFLPGPRLKAASFERNASYIDRNASPLESDSAQGPESQQTRVAEVEKFCREMIELGVDSMKFILSGRGSVLVKNFEEMSYEEAELSAASAIAREHGINLLGHAYNSASIVLAIKYGFKAIYHCNFADEPTLDLMEAHKSDFFVVPAVGIIEAGLTRFDEMSPQALERKPEAQEGLKQINEAQLRLIPEMRKRGIRVLPGGDYGFAHNPHGRNAWEFELFVNKFGFEPAEVLTAATRDGGKIMGMGEELGLVKEGYLADLLLVDGDPLKEITLFQDRSRLLMIMQEGRLHKGTRLIQR